MLYIIVGILVLLYVPFSLKGRVKMIMKTNEVFSKPLHFEIDEKNIKSKPGRGDGAASVGAGVQIRGK